MAMNSIFIKMAFKVLLPAHCAVQTILFGEIVLCYFFIPPTQPQIFCGELWKSSGHNLKFSKAQIISIIRIYNLHSSSDLHHKTMLSSCAKKAGMLTAFIF